MNLTTRLDELSGQFPEKPAFIFSDQSDRWDIFTFKQLADLTDRVSRGLQACGPATGMRAALMSPPGVEFFGLAFALLKAGIVPVIVDPAIGLAKVTDCLRETEPEIFIGNSLTHALRRLLGWGKVSVKYNLTIPQILRNSSHLSEHPSPATLRSPRDPAAIIYTSGSTGRPKGVLYTHGNFNAQLEMLVRTFDIRQDEIDLPAFPLYALIDALIGVTSVIPDINFPVPGKVDAARTLSAIQRYEVTNIFASPVVLDRLAAYGVEHHTRLPSLKRVITAGAPAPFRVQEQFREMLSEHADLFGVYGATETLPISLIESREVLADARHKSAKGAGICIGRPVHGATVRVIGISDLPIDAWQDSLELPTNQIGEITVQGLAVTRSYIHQEDANRLSKIGDDDEIIHRMGDVGYFDDTGRLWFCGRKSQRVETRYGTFFTEQIEGIFNSHPSVYRTALIGAGKEPVLWVELEAGERNKEKIKQELIAKAKDHPQASKIKTVLFMKKFPTDVRHNSKIIREKLTRVATGSPADQVDS